MYCLSVAELAAVLFYEVWMDTRLDLIHVKYGSLKSQIDLDP